ncbi:restriction endonuclease subunit S [Pseudomonas oryzihabitans]|uniref:restriction endonuclease subunit S n=1 Tax=Pseudomonas oryzihabitans TaxID=47885 RepID=UPI002864DF82|nr:restriction endonuclease subunit S [Pseudomonas psychrotolerans]MDR6679012.1 type I restriction enzyme S subunit [Pseudomonas psychrotolerans]
MSELPRGWTYVPIGDLCNLINGRAFKPQEWSDSGLPIIRIQNLNNPKAKFNYYSGSLENKHHIKSGDLLFAWSGTPGTSFGAHIWNRGNAALNQHIFKIEFPDLSVDRDFLRYAINQKLDELIGSAQGGVGLRHVTKGTFEKTEIAFPPFAEQTRIAAKLDELLAQVATLKVRIDGIPALLKRFRQSVLATAVSGRLTEDWRRAQMTLEETENSILVKSLELPVDWQKTLLSSVISDLRYGTAQKCDYGIGSIGVLRIPNIGEYGINLTDLKSSNFSKSEIEKLSLQAGDIILIRSNGSVELVGKSAVVTQNEEGLLFAGYLIRVRLDREKVIPEYVNFWFRSPAVRQLIELTARSTSGVNNINSEEIRSLVFTRPSLEEQTEIVRRIEQLFAFADQLEARVKAAQARIDRLTQSILAKAFRGELVPQDPNDEPASVLLERIKAQRAAAPKARRGRQAAKLS